MLINKVTFWWALFSWGWGKNGCSGGGVGFPSQEGKMKAEREPQGPGLFGQRKAEARVGGRIWGCTAAHSRAVELCCRCGSDTSSGRPKFSSVSFCQCLIRRSPGLNYCQCSLSFETGDAVALAAARSKTRRLPPLPAAPLPAPGAFRGEPRPGAFRA